jgi:hypothetical protein
MVILHWSIYSIFLTIIYIYIYIYISGATSQKALYIYLYIYMKLETLINSPYNNTNTNKVQTKIADGEETS